MALFKCIFFFLQYFLYSLHICLQLFELLSCFFDQPFIDLFQFLPKLVDPYTFLLFSFSSLNLERVISGAGVVRLGLIAEEMYGFF